jgi:hypothetical protein
VCRLTFRSVCAAMILTTATSCEAAAATTIMATLIAFHQHRLGVSNSWRNAPLSA